MYLECDTSQSSTITNTNWHHQRRIDGSWWCKPATPQKVMSTSKIVGYTLIENHMLCSKTGKGVNTRHYHMWTKVFRFIKALSDLQENHLAQGNWVLLTLITSKPCSQRHQCKSVLVVFLTSIHPFLAKYDIYYKVTKAIHLISYRSIFCDDKTCCSICNWELSF